MVRQRRSEIGLRLFRRYLGRPRSRQAAHQRRGAPGRGDIAAGKGCKLKTGPLHLLSIVSRFDQPRPTHGLFWSVLILAVGQDHSELHRHAAGTATGKDPSHELMARTR